MVSAFGDFGGLGVAGRDMDFRVIHGPDGIFAQVPGHAVEALPDGLTAAIFAAQRHSGVQGMKGIVRGLLVVACVAAAVGAGADERYRFEAYPASTVTAKAVGKIDWKSNPAYAGDLKSKDAVMWTVGKKADFAGHFVVTSFSCGTGCESTAFVDVNDGKIYKAPMQFPSEDADLPKANGAKAYQVSSNLIFMSSLDYQGTDMVQSDGVVVFDEKSKQFRVLAKSKPRKMAF